MPRAAGDGIFIRTGVFTAIVALFVAAIVILCAARFLFLSGAPEPPSFEKVRADYTSSESVLLDRHGEVLHQLRTDNRARRLAWTPLAQVSPGVTAAVLGAEDRRFYGHHGVDWRSMPGALTGGRGASTITMQLVALLDKGLRPIGGHRSLSQKILQIRSALRLEKSWSKGQILEAYLNLVSFRGELQGITAAAEGLFGRQPHGLSSVESVILAALLRSPNALPGIVEARARRLASAMDLDLPVSEISRETAGVFSRPYFISRSVALAPHVARTLFSGREPVPERQCTLDRDLQQFVTECLQRHILSVRSRNLHDGAALVLDNRSGDVLAYVGNIGEQSTARNVDGVQALRQAGSTLKPFIYGAAFEGRLLTAASLLDDSALDVPVPGGIYRPSNYDNSFGGPVSVRVALASSLNVPAVKTLNLFGVDAFLNVMRSAGFENLQSAEFYGPSLALGAADIDLWDLTNAYRSLANQGLWSPTRLAFDEPPTPARKVFSPATAFMIGEILSDRESRSRTFNLESPLSTRFWTAVKTGTSKDMRDNWCIGFSERYTIGVWAGNFSGEPMWNVSGITGAAPVWVEIMNRLHRDQTSHAPQAPRGVIAGAAPGGAGNPEWFLLGTEGAVAPGQSLVVSRIVYPAPGTVIALDPDIPPEDQKLFFEADPKDDTLQWRLDGNAICDAGALCLWAPTRGKHVLNLMDLADRSVDSLTFEVRGAGN